MSTGGRLGIDMDDAFVRGDLDRLRVELERALEAGMGWVELGASGLYAIRGGLMDRERAIEARRVLGSFPLRYTLHAPDSVDLGTPDAAGLEEQVLGACVELASYLGCTRVVCHAGRSAADAPEERARRREREVEALRRVGRVAEAMGLVLSVENLDPLPRTAQLRSAGGAEPEEPLSATFPALVPWAVADLAAEAGPSAVLFALDVGHWFLSSAALGLDFLEGVRRVAGRVGHLHVNDNYGLPEHRAMHPADRVAWGRGDCHLPPGSGSIPLRAVADLLRGYAGPVILEVREPYRGDLERLRRQAAEILGL